MLTKRSSSAASAIFVVAILSLLSAPTRAASADNSKDNSKFPFGCPVKEGYVNVTGGKVWYEIVGSGKYLNAVNAPNTDITYAYGTTIPAIGTLYLATTYASGTSTDYAPNASTSTEW